jgi:ABC-type polysaccharide/polyol phosphate export permease
MFNKAFKDLRAGVGLYKVWSYQAYHEITAKYKRTVFGSLWITGSMITTSLGLSLVFGGIFNQSIQQSLPFTMGGILCFGLLAYILAESAEAFISVSGIIKNHAYPFSYYILEGITRNFLTFLHNLVVFYVFAAIMGALRIPHWTVLPGIILVLLTMFTWGTLIGMLSSRFRDLRFLIPYISQLLFFLTPIFWRAEQLSGPRSALVKYNPFYGLIEIIRSPLLGEAAPMICWLSAGISATSGVVLWVIFFTAYRRRIPFWV